VEAKVVENISIRAGTENLSSVRMLRWLSLAVIYLSGVVSSNSSSPVTSVISALSGGRMALCVGELKF